MPTAFFSSPFPSRQKLPDAPATVLSERSPDDSVIRQIRIANMPFTAIAKTPAAVFVNLFAIVVTVLPTSPGDTSR